MDENGLKQIQMGQTSLFVRLVHHEVDCTKRKLVA
jgi:hypothetical protein